MRVVLRTALILGLIFGWQGSPDLRALESGQKLSVELVGISTDYFKGKFGATDQTSSSGADLAEGETGQSYLAYGWVNEKAGFSLGALCWNGSGGMKPSDDPAAKRAEIFASQKPAHYWWAEYRVLPSEIGKVALEVTWEHWSTVGTGTPVRVAGDTRRIEMREGEKHVLDFVSFTPSADDYCASNVPIAITAKVEEDPQFQNESLAYDVWFEHRDGHGAVTQRHAETVGRQGESVATHVEPMRFRVPGLSFADGAGVDAILELNAHVQGRVQTNGSVVVQLSVRRWVGVSRPDLPRRGGNGDGGSKIFTLTPGETVRLTLPPKSSSAGREGIDRTMDAAGKIQESSDNTNIIWVVDKEFYAGSQDSIILTVNRVR